MGRNCLILISALEHGDRVAVLERDDRLFPAGRGAAGATSGDLMPAHLHGPHIGHRHPEQFLQRLPDLVLVGFRMHLEGVFLPGLVGRRALLGYYRPDDDLMQRRHYLDPLFFLGAAFFLAGLSAAFLAVVFLVFALAFGAGFSAFTLLTFAAGFTAAGRRFLSAFSVLSALSASVSSGSGSGMTPVRALSSTTTASDQRMS